MFTVYALNLADPTADTETECATLDEALCHLRELISGDVESREIAPTICYGIRMA